MVMRWLSIHMLMGMSMGLGTYGKRLPPYSAAMGMGTMDSGKA